MDEEDLEKELETINHCVSHDLRAPLRAIDGFSQIVLEDYGPGLDEEGRRLLGAVRQNTQKMGRLIDELLAYLRARRIPLARAEVDMGSLAGSVIDEIKKFPEGARATFRLAALPPAFADPSLVRMVLSQLLSNAVKFSAKAHEPLIEVSAQGESYRVADNGVGFDGRYAYKLFELFQRLHTETEFPGTGAGLALARLIVSRHGGRIWAEGEPGRGASFYFTLS